MKRKLTLSHVPGVMKTHIIRSEERYFNSPEVFYFNASLSSFSSLACYLHPYLLPPSMLPNISCHHRNQNGMRSKGFRIQSSLQEFMDSAIFFPSLSFTYKSQMVVEKKDLTSEKRSAFSAEEASRRKNDEGNDGEDLSFFFFPFLRLTWLYKIKKRLNWMEQEQLHSATLVK